MTEKMLIHYKALYPSVIISESNTLRRKPLLSGVIMSLFTLFITQMHVCILIIAESQKRLLPGDGPSYAANFTCVDG